MAIISRHKSSSVFHRSRPKSRYLLSIGVGITLGFALSFACIPLMSICDNSPSMFLEPLSAPLNRYSNKGIRSLREKLDSMGILSRQPRSVADVTLVDYRSKDYEPRIQPLHRGIVKSNNSKVNNNNKNKSVITTTHPPNPSTMIRPRYIADELGIREKVLVAVLADTNRLNTFGLFLNQTLQEHVNHLSFFINDNIEDFPKGMQVIAINDERTYLKPFYILKYLAEKMINQYDWFFLVPDNTFIRGYKVNVSVK